MTRIGNGVLCSALAFTLAFSVSAAATAADATGNWNVTASGEALVKGTAHLQQSGASLAGIYGQDGSIDGSFKPGTQQVDGTWTDARGTGWLTILFAADGNKFSGEWGYTGRRPSGTFAATGLVPAYPMVSGLYNVTANGGPEFAPRRVKLHQLGQTVVGNFGPGTQLGGAIAPKTSDLDGTWQGPGGSGWVKLRFTSDGKGFQGDWGLASETQARGHIVGTIVNTAQTWVRGLWDTASSGGEFAVGRLKLQQDGQTVTGLYKDGHLQGTLPKGSNVLTGRWRDVRGTGNLVFRISPDGGSFEGTWTSKSNTSGRIIGKHVIAASPALHQ